MIRILQRTKLALEQDIFPIGDGLAQECAGIADIRTNHLAVLQESCENLVRIQLRLMVQMLDQHIFDLADTVYLVAQLLLASEKLAHLETDLCVFVTVKRCDAGLGRSKGLTGQSRLLVGIQKDMIRHHDLRTVRHENLRSRNPLALQIVDLIQQVGNIQRDTIADHTRRMSVENTGRQKVQCELSVIIDDCMTSIAAALETNDDVRLRSQHIRDFTFSLIAPAGADNRFYHK